MVGAEALRDERRRRAAEHGGVAARRAPERGRAGSRPRRRRRSRWCPRPRPRRPGPSRRPRRRRARTPSAPQRRGHAADAALEQRAAAVLEVVRAGQREHLLVVRQQVVELRKRRRDPVEQPGSPGARMSAEVTTPCSRARARSWAAASPPMNSGPPRCRCVAASISAGGRRPGRRCRWRRSRGRPAARRRADRQHAGGGLHVVAAHEQRGVDAVALEQGEQHVADRVAADRARARTSAPSFASVSAVPPAEPAAVMRISSTSSPPWPSGIASTGRTSTSSTCTPIASALIASVIVFLVPCAWCRSCARPRRPPPPRAARRRARAARRAPPRASRRCRPTRAAASSSTAASRSRPWTIAPWFAISAAVRPSSASSTDVGQLGRAEGRVGRHRHGAAEQQHLVVHAGQLVEHARERGRHRRVGVHDRAGVVAAVDAEVQVELGGGRELAVHRSPSRSTTVTCSASSSASTAPVGVIATWSPLRALDVAGGAEHEALGGEPPARGRDLLALAASGAGRMVTSPALVDDGVARAGAAARNGRARGRGRARRRRAGGRGGQAPPAQARRGTRDVVVVGAGFAGLTAARELAKAAAR